MISIDIVEEVDGCTEDDDNAKHDLPKEKPYDGYADNYGCRYGVPESSLFVFSGKKPSKFLHIID